MRVQLVVAVIFFSAVALPQTHTGKIVPAITTVPIETGTVTVLHLAEGYATSVKVPEEITSVVIGNPTTFRAEHSEAEPQLVFIKPVTSAQCESNALITTKSGQHISLYLVSGGRSAASARVDFLLEYRLPQSLSSASDRESFLIPETISLLPKDAIEPPRAFVQEKNVVIRELEKQQHSASLVWQGKELLGAVGNPVRQDDLEILSFSVLNNSKRTIELLPPQIELTNTDHANGSRQIKAEPIAISDFRMTARRLEPSERIDGVVVFKRPAFKESSERISLEIIDAESIDKPLRLVVPFTWSAEGEEQ
ncbi:MAG: hypothetical protein JOZ44_00880 [Acidobacteria bacterium]|nr:hypothetical protein [Acidobacteriota bacterium]